MPWIDPVHSNLKLSSHFTEWPKPGCRFTTQASDFCDAKPCKSRFEESEAGTAHFSNLSTISSRDLPRISEGWVALSLSLRIRAVLQPAFFPACISTSESPIIHDAVRSM